MAGPPPLPPPNGPAGPVIASFFPADSPQLVYIKKDGTEVLITGFQFTSEQQEAFRTLSENHHGVSDFTVCLDTLVGMGTQDNRMGKQVLIDYLKHPQYDDQIARLRTITIGGKPVKFPEKKKLEQDRVTTSDKLKPAFETKRYRTMIQKVKDAFNKTFLGKEPETTPSPIKFTEDLLKETLAHLNAQQNKINAIEEFHAIRFVLKNIKDKLENLKTDIEGNLTVPNTPENMKTKLKAQQKKVEEALDWYNNKLDRFAVYFGGVHREVPLDQRTSDAHRFLGLIDPKEKEREKAYVQNLQVADRFDDRLEYHNTCLAQGIVQTSLTDEHFIIAAAHQLLGLEPDKAVDILKRMPHLTEILEILPAGGAVQPLQLNYAPKLQAQRQAAQGLQNAPADIDLIRDLRVAL